MIRMEITIQNLDRVRAAFHRSPQSVRKGLDKAITRSALLVQREARKESPVDLGLLRNSIGLRLLNLGAVVSPSAKYALFVHEGTGRFARGGRGRSTPWVYKSRNGFRMTRGQRANPFMERAASLSEPQVRRIFDTAVDDIVSEVAA